jgi:hypothetical protein
MAKYYFPGYPAFFEAAAKINHLPELVGQAHRCPALEAMANLCAQAVEAEAEDVEEILDRASGFLDQLLVAHEAAKLMLEKVSEGLGGARSSPSEVSGDAQGPESSDPGALILKA